MTERPRITLSEAAAMIAQARRLTLYLHVSPDGDSIGSTLGLYLALKAAGKEVVCLSHDPIPRVYRFLPAWQEAFVPWEQVSGPFDLSVLIDCGDRYRVGDVAPVIDMAPVVLNIDHHLTNSAYGDYNVLDYSAAAAGELTYQLIQLLGLPITQEIATCLYTAIVTDTGSFKYPATTADTHRIAAALLDVGVKPYDVAQAIFENETAAGMHLLAAALANLHVDGRLAWLWVDQALLQATGTKEEDTEGLVNYARQITGVEVGAFFRESAGGTVKVSLRSRSEVDVSAIAQVLGGGGHARAAGITLSGLTLQAAMDKVLAAVRAAL